MTATSAKAPCLVFLVDADKNGPGWHCGALRRSRGHVQCAAHRCPPARDLNPAAAELATVAVEIRPHADQGGDCAPGRACPVPGVPPTASARAARADGRDAAQQVVVDAPHCTLLDFRRGDRPAVGVGHAFFEPPNMVAEVSGHGTGGGPELFQPLSFAGQHLRQRPPPTGDELGQLRGLRSGPRGKLWPHPARQKRASRPASMASVFAAGATAWARSRTWRGLAQWRAVSRPSHRPPPTALHIPPRLPSRSTAAATSRTAA